MRSEHRKWGIDHCEVASILVTFIGPFPKHVMTKIKHLDSFFFSINVTVVLSHSVVFCIVHIVCQHSLLLLLTTVNVANFNCSNLLHIRWKFNR